MICWGGSEAFLLQQREKERERAGESCKPVRLGMTWDPICESGTSRCCETHPWPGCWLLQAVARVDQVLVESFGLVQGYPEVGVLSRKPISAERPTHSLQELPGSIIQVGASHLLGPEHQLYTYELFIPWPPGDRALRPGLGMRSFGTELLRSEVMRDVEFPWN